MKSKDIDERIEDTNKPNKVWYIDVTILTLKNSRLYLSTIIDRYDRKVVAYKISKYNDDKLVIDTLNEAIQKRKDVKGLIIMNDQGFQYTSYEYKAICESNGITNSMARKGIPKDNSPIESWLSLLKKETLYNNNNTSLEEYQNQVKEWIEYYNKKRNKEKKEENENELIYKMEAIIKYLKKQNGYKYKLYNRLCPGMGKPDSNIVEYSIDCLELINELIEKVNKKQRMSLFE